MDLVVKWRQIMNFFICKYFNPKAEEIKVEMLTIDFWGQIFKKDIYPRNDSVRKL